MLGDAYPNEWPPSITPSFNATMPGQNEERGKGRTSHFTGIAYYPEPSFSQRCRRIRYDYWAEGRNVEDAGKLTFS